MDQYDGKDYYYGSYDPSGGSVNADDFPGGGLGVDGICRNPAGLIFKATVNYYVDGETAWGYGDRFTEDKNWATFFNYTVQCCQVDPGLVNGGFEAPAVGTSAGWNIYASGASGLGWTVEWADTYVGAPATPYLELHRGVNSWTPYEGFQYAELDTDWQGPGSAGGEQASVTISQDLATCPGFDYTLTFYYSPRPGHSDNSLGVTVAGSSVGSYSGNGGSNTNWTKVTYDFTATSDTTTLAFEETGTADSFGMFLDDVSVVLK
jgi:hypothetical protein